MLGAQLLLLRRGEQDSLACIQGISLALTAKCLVNKPSTCWDVNIDQETLEGEYLCMGARITHRFYC